MNIYSKKSKEDKIKEFRQSKPIFELERKYNKAKGRHSSNKFIAEFLDLCVAKAKQTCILFGWRS